MFPERFHISFFQVSGVKPESLKVHFIRQGCVCPVTNVNSTPRPVSLPELEFSNVIPPMQLELSPKQTSTFPDVFLCYQADLFFYFYFFFAFYCLIWFIFKIGHFNQADF